MSGLSLFVLTGQYREAADRLAELEMDEATVADTLESLSGDLEVKATSVAHVALNFEKAAMAIREHAAQQLIRAKAIEARAEALRDYIAKSLQAAGITKVEGPSLRLSFRKSEAIVIDGADLLPAEFMRVPPVPAPEPNKVAIKAALKLGATVPGARIEIRQSLQIGG